MTSFSARPHLGERLRELAGAHLGRAALIAPDGSTATFGQLHRSVAGFSRFLDQRGMGRGSHVVLLLPMGIELYVALLGIIWGGRTAVLMDPSADKARLDRALDRVGVDGLVATRRAHALRLALGSLRGLDLYVTDRWLGPFAHRLRDDLAPGELRSPPDGEPALVTFTTGTTGTPKAIGRTHRFLLDQHRILADHMDLGAHDIDLPTLPVFLLNSLAAGATCVLPDGDLRDVARLDPERIVGQIRRWGVTTSSGSPAFFRPVADWLGERDEVLEGIRALFIGGARVPLELLADLREVVPGARIEVVYGSTEAEPIATLEAGEALTTADPTAGACVGRPVGAVEVRLIDPEEGEVVAEGQVGEVQVAGPHVNEGYYRDPAAEAANKVREEGRTWHRTGDAAWRDGAGRLWLVGRIGEQVAGRWPFPVEAAAEAVEGVERAGLVAVEGAAVLAYVGAAEPETVTRAGGVERAVRVEAIPLDPRHRAKVDRGALAAATVKALAAATAGQRGQDVRCNT